MIYRGEDTVGSGPQNGNHREVFEKERVCHGKKRRNSHDRLAQGVSKTCDIGETDPYSGEKPGACSYGEYVDIPDVSGGFGEKVV
jgi:hypothetical protein